MAELQQKAGSDEGPAPGKSRPPSAAPARDLVVRLRVLENHVALLEEEMLRVLRQLEETGIRPRTAPRLLPEVVGGG